MTTRAANSKKTNSIAAAFTSTPWLSYVLVVGIGGAIYMLVNLALLHFSLEYYEEGPLVDPQSKTSLFLPLAIFFVLLLIWGRRASKQINSFFPGNNFDLSTSICVLVVIFGLSAMTGVWPSSAIAFSMTFIFTGLAAYLLLSFFSSFQSIRLTAMAIWFFAYMFIWKIGTSAPISLPIFIVIWTAIGFGGGLFLYSIAKTRGEIETTTAERERTKANNSRTQAEGVAQTRRRAARTSGIASRYGRIPQDTVDLLNNHIRRITGPIAAALPIGASVSRRNQTVSILLDTVICDWRENDNFDFLTPDDIEDFQSFIEAASHLSGSEEYAINAAIYNATLKALAQDWLANWNATNNSGPPERIY